MINKQGLWFLTLFSLILVLSIYYITMSNEIFKIPSLPKSIPTNINDIKAGIPNLSENFSANTQSKIAHAIPRI